MRTLTTIPVFYSDNMVCQTNSFSPSSNKPKEVMASWQRLAVPLEIRDVVPVTREQLALAHKKSFVNGVLDLTLRNGFDNYDATVAATLPYTTGAMLQAARMALKNKSVAIAPVSGFHHATYEWGDAFCTFNGLMVTAFVLRQEKLIDKIGILDFDCHYGNGTDDIIDKTKSRSWINHYSAGDIYDDESFADIFLNGIGGILYSMRDCDLILYQAGADPHIDDPLGGWLTTEQLRLRDYTVFNIAQRLGIPVAWNLAGGYQRDKQGGIRPVLDIHDNTLKACQSVYLA